MDLTTVKDISIVVAGIATLAGFMAALVEYARQNHAKRAEHFVDLRRRFLETPSFQTILTHLDADSEELSRVPIQDRRNFLGFLEEIQLMVDSHLVRPEIAHIMFGRYVRLADQSRHLWVGLERNDRYWAIFRRMVQDEQRLASRELRQKRFRF